MSSHRAALIVLAVGITAAMHVGKLPPAVPALQRALGMSLMEAGFLLAMMQAPAMALGVFFGAFVDGLGHRRSMLWGLGVLACASLAGASTTSAVALMALRVLEGVGFLLVVLAAPPLLRATANSPEERTRLLSTWGSYMPAGTGLALLVGPLLMAWVAWTWWWVATGVLTALAWCMVWWGVPRTTTNPMSATGTAPSPSHAFASRLRETLSVPGPWAVALTFSLYALQWIAVIGFLPTIYTQAGYASVTTAVLTAFAAAINIVGNLGAGWLLSRGATAPRLIGVGLVVMAGSSLVAFVEIQGVGAPSLMRYLAVLAFSAVGGLVPASLFTCAPRVAPSPHAVSTTLGWMQQWSALGQFVGPPLAAWMAGFAVGWHMTWVVTLGAATLALMGAWWLGHCLRTGSISGPVRTT